MISIIVTFFTNIAKGNRSEEICQKKPILKKVFVHMHMPQFIEANTSAYLSSLAHLRSFYLNNQAVAPHFLKQNWRGCFITWKLLKMIGEVA